MIIKINKTFDKYLKEIGLPFTFVREILELNNIEFKLLSKYYADTNNSPYKEDCLCFESWWAYSDYYIKSNSLEEITKLLLKYKKLRAFL